MREQQQLHRARKGRRRVLPPHGPRHEPILRIQRRSLLVHRLGRAQRVDQALLSDQDCARATPGHVFLAERVDHAPAGHRIHKGGFGERVEPPVLVHLHPDCAFHNLSAHLHLCRPPELLQDRAQLHRIDVTRVIIIHQLKQRVQRLGVVRLLLGVAHLAQLEAVGSAAAVKFRQREHENAQRQQLHDCKGDSEVKVADAGRADQAEHVNVDKGERRHKGDKVGRPLDLDDRRQRAVDLRECDHQIEYAQQIHPKRFDAFPALGQRAPAQRRQRGGCAERQHEQHNANRKRLVAAFQAHEHVPVVPGLADRAQRPFRAGEAALVDQVTVGEVVGVLVAAAGVAVLGAVVF